MKLVKEHINETQNFTRGLDPKVAMGIGNLYYGKMGTAGRKMHHAFSWKMHVISQNNVKVKKGTKWINLEDYVKKYHVRCEYDKLDTSTAWIKYIGTKENLIKLWRDLFDREIDENGYSVESGHHHIKKMGEK